MKIPKSLYNRLAKILGGTGVSNDTCSITIERNLNATIVVLPPKIE
ncbi:hypothetical protein HPY28_18330 [Brevibacillus sp. HB1.2]|nr:MULTISPECIES: hypothetical protein [unclassified Brevibacillus]NTU22284.1 hypothetical protein [Brevibacillus sp. HB1.2]NTU28808.1 hypothetical protein [Brevibacillus sp. HB1.1]